MTELNAESIINYIQNAPKKTPVKVYINGDVDNISFPDTIQVFKGNHSAVLFGDLQNISPILTNHLVSDYHLESQSRNSAVPLLDTTHLNARIEPGAIIRDQVVIGDHAVVMMGAVINIGCEIGADTMIDMGVVMGGRALVGKHCHIGAGAVLAGVVEPASAKPVQVDDNVLIGANAVVIEGVHIGEGAVVAAGAIVTKDVAPHTLVAGNPAHVIKRVDSQTESKTALEDALRKL